MARYEEVGERILLVMPETDEAAFVEIESNPRRAKPTTVQMPLGPYEDLSVRVALVRHPEYGKHKAVRISSSKDVYKLVKSMEVLPQESLYVLLLNARNKVIGITEVARGTSTRTIIDPSDVFRAAIVANAPSIVIVHNHPSGEVEPSAEDIALVRSIKKAGDMLGIKILDSVIIGDGEYVSMADRGLMD
jgi:DNA repair protein RadC